MRVSLFISISWRFVGPWNVSWNQQWLEKPTINGGFHRENLPPRCVFPWWVVNGLSWFQEPHPAEVDCRPWKVGLKWIGWIHKFMVHTFLSHLPKSLYPNWIEVIESRWLFVATRLEIPCSDSERIGSSTPSPRKKKWWKLYTVTTANGWCAHNLGTYRKDSIISSVFNMHPEVIKHGNGSPICRWFSHSNLHFTGISQPCLITWGGWVQALMWSRSKSHRDSLATWNSMVAPPTRHTTDLFPRCIWKGRPRDAVPWSRSYLTSTIWLWLT